MGLGHSSGGHPQVDPPGWRDEDGSVTLDGRSSRARFRGVCRRARPRAHRWDGSERSAASLRSGHGYRSTFRGLHAGPTPLNVNAALGEALVALCEAVAGVRFDLDITGSRADASRRRARAVAQRLRPAPTAAVAGPRTGRSRGAQRRTRAEAGLHTAVAQVVDALVLTPVRAEPAAHEALRAAVAALAR